jgi:hypothetical protein
VPAKRRDRSRASIEVDNRRLHIFATKGRRSERRVKAPWQTARQYKSSDPWWTGNQSFGDKMECAPRPESADPSGCCNRRHKRGAVNAVKSGGYLVKIACWLACQSLRSKNAAPSPMGKNGLPDGVNSPMRLGKGA